MPRIRRSRALAAAAAVTAGLLLASCTGQTSGSSSQPTGTPDPDATLNIALALEPVTLDIRSSAEASIEQALLDNVYEGLVTRDQQNEVQPALAEEYEISDDGLSYTFTLHEGVTFHDGSELTATDVADSLAAVVEDESIQGHDELTGVTSVIAPDPRTVVIELSEPNQNLLFSLTGPAGVVLNSGDETDMRTAANGTGPFTLAEWNEGSNIVLQRNDDYWGEPAGVAEVVLNYIPDANPRINAGLDGSVDVVSRVDPELQSQIDGVNGFRLETGQTTDKWTLAFNNNREPLDDVRVREALRLAVDREALVQTVGAGTPAYGPIPELDPGYEDLSGVVQHDPQRAKQLLKEAGQQDLELELTIPSLYGTTFSTYLVSAYDDIGVDLTVQPVEFSVWLDRVMDKHNYDLSFVWHVEPRDFVNFANPDYYFGYDNPEVQQLYSEAMTTVDPEESADLLAEAARIVSEDHAADWLGVDQSLTALAPGVANFPLNSTNNRLPLAGVTVAR